MYDKLDRIKGSLIGLAIGDALGVHHEFKKRSEVVPIQTYTDGNPYNIPKGYWTDDTSMALCMANSLIETKEFNPTDIMNKFCQWQRKGYMSSTGECFDIGGTTRHALMEYWRNPQEGPYRGLTEVMSAGNGSIMRLAPIPLFFNNNVVDAISYAEQSSRITHGYVDCTDGCRLLSECIFRLINDQPIFNVLNGAEGFVRSVITIQDKLSPMIQDIADGSFFNKTENEIRAGGGVTECLEASLWSLATTKSFEEAVLKAVNLGDDADTAGAVTGQLAGAYYGYNSIPKHLLDGLHDHNSILNTATQLYKLSLENK